MSEWDFRDSKMMVEKHLENVSDLTMLVLKGHLIIEKELFNALRRHCVNPEFFEKANLRYIQMVHLARALFPSETDSQRVKVEKMYWECLEALNGLRNVLAHRLEPVMLSDLLRRLQVRKASSEDPLTDIDVINDLGITISFLIGWTNARGDRQAYRA